MTVRGPISLIAILVVLFSAWHLPGAVAAEPDRGKPAVTRPSPRVQPPDPAREDASTARQLSESARAERAVSRKPKDRAARIQAARAQLAAGAETSSRVDSAQSHAKAVLEDNPSDVEALLIAAQTSLLKNDLTNAERYYRAATQADGNNATAFLGLGDVLTRMGDEAGATVAFERYRQLKKMPALDAGSSTN